MLSFKSAISLCSFTFIKRLLSSSYISAIRVVSSAYLKLLIRLLNHDDVDGDDGGDDGDEGDGDGDGDGDVEGDDGDGDAGDDGFYLIPSSCSLPRIQLPPQMLSV